MFDRLTLDGKLALLLGSGLFLIVIVTIVVLLLLRPANKIIREERFEGVIFSKENAAQVMGFMLTNDRADNAYWTPTKGEIVTIEEQFAPYVQDQLPAVARNLSGYKRQYIGFERDGRRQLMIVGFCNSPNAEWGSELVTVPDAGGCYLEAQYDVTNGDFLYVWEGLPE